jgi:hypothetical protein
MNAVIDMGSELLLDLSEVCDPYVRLLAAALGQTLAEGSPWVALDKQSAALFGLSPANAHPALAAVSRGRTLRRPPVTKRVVA